MHHFTGLLGVLALIAVAWLLSTDRRRVDWRLVLIALGLQLAFATLILVVPGTVQAFELLSKAVVTVIGFADRGAEFIFGKELTRPDRPWGFVFAFKVLPIIIFFAALMRVLYFLGIMQRIIAALAWLFRATLRITALEALTASANIFVGQTEAPLAIKPYLERMTRSQLMIVMTTGFATIAGSVLTGIVLMLGVDSTGAAQPQLQAEFAKHLLTASLMSAPGAFAIAKIMVPETEHAPDESLGSLRFHDDAVNVLDAASRGTRDGLLLAANVAAMLIAFVALIALVDWPIRALGSLLGHDDLSLRSILGTLLSPVAWLIGIPPRDVPEVASLIGTQIVATEFIAYEQLGQLVRDHAADPDAGILPRSQRVAAYALCGFCNLASVGIQLGAFGAMVPSRSADFSRLALRAMLAGAMACWMTGAIAGLLIR